MRNSNSQPGASPATEAKRLIRRGLKASLATIDRETGYPYASLITVATSAQGEPVFLISRLARHTANLLADPRASILYDGTDGLGDPLQGGRVSLWGEAVASDEDPRLKERFLARHPSAEGYAGFADFSFYSLRIEGAHYVGGFGSIHGFSPDDLLTPLEGTETLLAAEPGIVEHMNDDHADAVELYATRLLGAGAGPWRFSGCDPEGCDLVLRDRALRLDFPERVTSPQTIRKTLAQLARNSRS